MEIKKSKSFLSSIFFNLKIATDMKFTLEHKVGTDYSTVKFNGNYLTTDYKVRDKLIRSFQRLGGEITEGGNWIFPSFITSEVIKEVIHNTCFVCGGLMQDETKEIETREGKRTDIYFIKVRKCCSCGHGCFK